MYINLLVYELSLFYLQSCSATSLMFFNLSTSSCHPRFGLSLSARLPLLLLLLYGCLGNSYYLNILYYLQSCLTFLIFFNLCRPRFRSFPILCTPTQRSLTLHRYLDSRLLSDILSSFTATILWLSKKFRPGSSASSNGYVLYIYLVVHVTHPQQVLESFFFKFVVTLLPPSSSSIPSSKIRL